MQREHKAWRLRQNEEGQQVEPFDTPLAVDLTRRLRTKTKPPTQLAAPLQPAQPDAPDGSAHLPTPQAAAEEFELDTDELGFTELDLAALGLLSTAPPVAFHDLPEEEDDWEWSEWG